MMRRTIVAWFQHLPPYPGAGSLRAASILRYLGDEEVHRGRLEELIVVTTTSRSSLPATEGRVIALEKRDVENASSLLRRVLGELSLGLVALATVARLSVRDALLVISSPAYIPALMLSWWARIWRRPYVLEVRDVYPQVYAEAGLMKRSSLVYRGASGLSRGMYRGARAVIVATKGLKREIAADAGDTAVTCVYNGFPGEFLKRRAAKHSRFTLCFHGVLGFFQDVETLVALARTLEAHQVDVVVIGYGRRESFVREAAGRNLRFLGRLPFDQTVEEVERCHVGLCLRLDDAISRDAFPVKVWEYLGLGVPSVVTPECEAGSFLVENGCGFQLPAGALEQLGELIDDLRNDPARLQAMSARCREVAREFTREKTGRLAAEVMLRAIEDRS